MMNRKIRLKLLEKIAQTAATTPTTPPTGQAGTQTTPVTTVNPAQPSVDLSALYGQINLPGGWDSSRIPYITRIVGKLDRATNAATNGKYNLRTLWPTFPAGSESQFTSPAKDILILLRKSYEQFLNKAVRYTKQLSADEVRQRIGVLLRAPELGKLEQINPAGPIGLANISLETIRQDLVSMMPPATAT